jgi:hypothetical protein
MPTQGDGRGGDPGQSDIRHLHDNGEPSVADQCDSGARLALQDAALKYAARGWPVFPCSAKGKTPLTTHGLKDASTHREHVRAWWKCWPQANIAIVTGPASGLLVIDLDGPGGRRSWERLTAAHGRVSTLVSLTGGGGVHALFAYPDGVELGNTAGRLGAGIDTRGQGGYIIAPPSLHASDRRYRWLGSCDVAPAVAAAQETLWRRPAPLPPWLLEPLLPPKPPVTPLAQPAAGDGEPGRLAAYVAQQPQGNRNCALYWAACTLLEHGHRGAALDQLAAAAVRGGLGEREVRATIDSALTRIQGRVS